jgi:hypothetical protein
MWANAKLPTSAAQIIASNPTLSIADMNPLLKVSLYMMM